MCAALTRKSRMGPDKLTSVKESSGDINALGANAAHIKTTLGDVESPVVEATLVRRSTEKVRI